MDKATADRSIKHYLKKAEYFILASQVETIETSNSQVLAFLLGCYSHDHTYDYSDDASVRRAGNADRARLVARATELVNHGYLKGTAESWKNSLSDADMVMRAISTYHPEYFKLVYTRPDEVTGLVADYVVKHGEAALMAEYGAWIETTAKHKVLCKEIFGLVNPHLLGYSAGGPDLDYAKYNAWYRQNLDQCNYTDTGIILPKAIQDALNAFIRDKAPGLLAHSKHWMRRVAETYSAIYGTVWEKEHKGFKCLHIAGDGYSSITVINGMV